MLKMGMKDEQHPASVMRVILQGVSQLLQHLEQGLRSACPPDLTAPAERTQGVWKRLVDDEARATADVLLAVMREAARGHR